MITAANAAKIIIALLILKLTHTHNYLRLILPFIIKTLIIALQSCNLPIIFIILNNLNFGGVPSKALRKH